MSEPSELDFVPQHARKEVRLAEGTFERVVDDCRLAAGPFANDFRPSWSELAVIKSARSQSSKYECLELPCIEMIVAEIDDHLSAGRSGTFERGKYCHPPKLWR